MHDEPLYYSLPKSGSNDTVANAKCFDAMTSDTHETDSSKTKVTLKRSANTIHKFSKQNKQYRYTLDGNLGHMTEYVPPGASNTDGHKVIPDPNKMICMVCNDTASGVHYGVLACEGCKVSDITSLVVEFSLRKTIL